MRTIHWSQTAQNDYWDNIEFLLNRWSESEAIDFINEVEQVLNTLRQGIRLYLNLQAIKAPTKSRW